MAIFVESTGKKKSDGASVTATLLCKFYVAQLLNCQFYRSAPLLNPVSESSYSLRSHCIQFMFINCWPSFMIIGLCIQSWEGKKVLLYLLCSQVNQRLSLFVEETYYWSFKKLLKRWERHFIGQRPNRKLQNMCIKILTIHVYTVLFACCSAANEGDSCVSWFMLLHSTRAVALNGHYTQISGGMWFLYSVFNDFHVW